uniref:Uncharacterized protein n=1 Tax=Cucumis melo TaxID=3656 RepID=A0A9I9CG17_CUCME
MAATLSASLTSNSALPQRKSCQPSRVFYNPRCRNIPFSYSFSHCKNIVKFSLRRTGVVVSAISGSPGIGSYVESGNTADLLESVKVFDLNGDGIPISDLWKNRKAVVAFARHFGFMSRYALLQDLLDASGVALVLIGPGSIDQAKAFSEQTKFQGEVYADPAHSSYEALNFVSGFTTTFTPKAARWHHSCRSRIKKLGMIQISKKFSRHVAHKVEMDSHTAKIQCHLKGWLAIRLGQKVFV